MFSDCLIILECLIYMHGVQNYHYAVILVSQIFGDLPKMLMVSFKWAHQAEVSFITNVFCMH